MNQNSNESMTLSKITKISKITSDLKKRELYMFAFKTNYALCMIIMTPSKSIVVGSKKSERATKFVGVIKNQIWHEHHFSFTTTWQASIYKVVLSLLMNSYTTNALSYKPPWIMLFWNVSDNFFWALRGLWQRQLNLYIFLIRLNINNFFCVITKFDEFIEGGNFS